MRKIFTFFICVFSLSPAAQETSPFAEFGSVTTTHLSNKFYKVDSNARAVVLADIGHTSIEGNSKGWFSLIIKKHRVVHILHREGYHEADIEIPLYSDGGDAEKIENIRAVTYNLENGSIRRTWLAKSGIYTEKVNKNLLVKKFVMPSVKQGSIIEYEFEVRSDFFSPLDPWYFQGPSPVLWSEFNLSLPRFFSYGIVSYGYHDYFINEKKDRSASFLVLKEEEPIGQRFHFSTSVSDYRWVLKNVPGLITENFTSTIKNHIARLEFQLSAHNAPLAPKTFTKTWPQLAESLLLSEHFGDPADPLNHWMKPEVDKMVQRAGSGMDSAQQIFQYVRDHFNCTDFSALWREQSFRQLWKNRSGSVAEINLLLTALLKQAGMEADPVILSTTDHGYVQEDYPMVSAFNYVISRLLLDGNIFYLDASQPLLGFGHLLPECYNGHARIINEQAGAVYLDANTINEIKMTAVFIQPGKGDEGWSASVKQTPGYFESYRFRNQIRQQGREGFFRDFQQQYGMEATIENLVIDSLNNYEGPLSLQYQLSIQPGYEHLLYINPMFGEGYKINPFQSASRKYPVEMPFATDETYILTLPIPQGYELEALPKQLIAKIDSAGQNYFEYLVAYSGSTISLRSRIKISKTMFYPGEYETLRNFFNLIVSKQNEQIVFRKIKNP